MEKIWELAEKKKKVYNWIKPLDHSLEISHREGNSIDKVWAKPMTQKKSLQTETPHKGLIGVRASTSQAKPHKKLPRKKHGGKRINAAPMQHPSKAVT